MRATEEQEETLGDKLKKLFVRSTPTPKPKKKKRTTSRPTPSATPAPSETPNISPTESQAVSPSPTTSASAQPTETAQPTVTVSESQQKRAEQRETQSFEPVRPISPGPRSRRRVSPRATTPAIATTPIATPTSSETPLEVRTPIPNETETSRPLPSLPPVAASSPTPAQKKSAAPPAVSPSATPVAKTSPTAAAGFSTDAIADSQRYSPEVRKIVDLSVELANQNLGYKYVSADPAKGGMDSSGFISYVLLKSGIKDAPRDARQQYIWVRKAGNFQAVLAQRDDTFELDALKPGDLLFWATNYGVSRDPEITQTMIYLGRDKASNQRLMVGASETQTPKGRSRPGVGVFEFKIGRPAKGNREAGPVFVGYGHNPSGQ